MNLLGQHLEARFTASHQHQPGNVAGQQAVKKYIADGEAFLSCMEKEEKANADSLTDEAKKANVERYNVVVDKMQVLAQNFNEQIKAYKAAQAEQ